MKKTLLFLALVGLAAHSQATVRGYWPGNQGSRLVDASSAGNNLLLRGTGGTQATTPQPPEGNAWLLQGPTTYANYLGIPNAAFTSYNTGALSMYFWISGTAGAKEAIFSQYGAGGSSNYFTVWATAAGYLQVNYVTPANGASITVTSASVMNGANHFVWIRSSSISGLQVYVDTVLVALDPNPPQFSTSTGQPDGAFAIGKDDSAALYTDSNVLIDAFQLGDSFSDAYLGPQSAQTPTNTPTSTATPTATQTPTGTPSNTPVYSPTPTWTNSPTPTSTWTNSPTVTQTRTPTPTSTRTPTSTGTPTSTVTATFTITPTFTNSPTSSPIPTAGQFFSTLSNVKMMGQSGQPVVPLDAKNTPEPGLAVVNVNGSGTPIPTPAGGGASASNQLTQVVIEQGTSGSAQSAANSLTTLVGTVATAANQTTGNASLASAAYSLTSGAAVNLSQVGGVAINTTGAQTTGKIPILVFDGNGNPIYCGLGQGDNFTKPYVLPVANFNYSYNGNGTWDRMRVVSGNGTGIHSSVNVSLSASTTLWTPAAGNKFRIMGVEIMIPNGATDATTGQLMTFFDNATTITAVPYTLPTVGVTTPGLTSIYIPLGNGYVSAVSNTALTCITTANLTSSCPACIYVQPLGVEGTQP